MKNQNWRHNISVIAGIVITLLFSICMFCGSMCEVYAAKGSEYSWYRIKTNYEPGIAVRVSPDSESTLLTRIQDGTEFFVEAISGVWGYTCMPNYEGWIHLDYAEEIYQAPVYPSNTEYVIDSDYEPGIAVRSIPSGDGTLYTRVPKGTSFFVERVCGVWGYTSDVGGYAGWVHLDYAYQTAVSTFASEDTPYFILPHSSSVRLDSEQIAGLTPQMLCYARNEIYAKNGRLFKSRELMEYFSSQIWYNGSISPDNFPESLLNEVERYNVDFLYSIEHNNSGGYILDQPGYDIHAVYGFVQPGPYGSSVGADVISSIRNGAIVELGTFFSLDLDSDGIEERISYSITDIKERNIRRCNLQVGNYSVSHEDESMINTIYGACLDGKNILLITAGNGPSDDPTSWFHRYRNGELIEIGCIEAFVGSLEISEGGIIGTIRNGLVGTHGIVVRWEINAVGMLELVQQDLYEFKYWDGNNNGWFGTTLNTRFGFYQSNNYQSPYIYMDPQEVRFTYTDSVNWVLVEGWNGQSGWFPAADYDNEEKNALFSKLRWAD